MTVLPLPCNHIGKVDIDLLLFLIAAQQYALHLVCLSLLECFRALVVAYIVL